MVDEHKSVESLIDNSWCFSCLVSADMDIVVSVIEGELDSWSFSDIVDTLEGLSGICDVGFAENESLLVYYTVPFQEVDGGIRGRHPSLTRGKPEEDCNQ